MHSALEGQVWLKRISRNLTRSFNSAIPPVRIDLITSINGVSWEQAAAGKAKGEYGGEPVPFLGRAELIANKKAAGRLQDLADLERLLAPPAKKSNED